MAKLKTPFNDLELWREYCCRLRKNPFPKTVADSLRIAVPEQHERIAGNWKMLGDEGPMPSLPYDGDQFAETRAPIARASTAIGKSKQVKQADTKRRHLQIALAWLECPHPWIGQKSKDEMDAMIVDVRRAIEDPTVSLDHLLDRSFYFRFHPKIRLSQEEKASSESIRVGVRRESNEQPSMLRRALGRLFD
ncbi:MAG: hypothetical protein HC871_02160 [Rhizobiales bacterium]|nr:hypothetical protein [Hyphomicrobiales bacterium]